jgi:hypothetical protein
MARQLHPGSLRFTHALSPRRQAAAFAGRIRHQGETRMNALIGVLITFLVIILVLYLVNMLPLDSRARQIVRVIVIVIGVLSLLRYLGVWF